MLKVMGVLAVLAAGAGQAMAQPPEILQPDEQIELAVGEARTLKFGESFKTAGTVTKGVAEIIPQSDRTLTISALAPGQTTMIVERPSAPDYVAAITVTPSEGHLVKFYGHHGVKDFVGSTPAAAAPTSTRN